VQAFRPVVSCHLVSVTLLVKVLHSITCPSRQ
jgi:hypothetical protein